MHAAHLTTATTLTLAALLAACASTSPTPPPELPASIRVPDRLALAHEVPATGVREVHDKMTIRAPKDAKP